MKIEYLPAGAPECLLIRTFGTEPGDFRLFLSAVRELATGMTERIALNSSAGFKGPDGCRLDLVLGGSDEAPAAMGQGWVWQLTKASWATVAMLVSPIAASPRIGVFQWLTDRIDGPAVLLSCSEDGSW